MQKFDTSLSAGLGSYLKDHCFGGMAVLPGSSYVSLAFEAAAGLGDGWNTISGLEFEQVFVLSEAVQILRIGLERNGDGSVTFEALSDAETAPVLHARGTLRKDGGQPVAVALEMVRERCSDEVEATDFYAALRRNGNEYGPAFQGIERLWTTRNEALARVVAPAGVDSSESFHPALLDACVQALSACHESHNRTYYLKSVDEIRLLGQFGSACWSHATIADEHASNSQAAYGSVWVYNDKGDLVVALDGVRLEYLETDESPRTRLALSATFTAEPVEESLAFWGSELGTPYDVEFAPYNQILQQLLDPESLISRNTDGANIILTRMEDWVRYRNELKLQVNPAEKDKILGELETHALPGGLEIAHLLKYETDYVYTEIFVDDVYGRHDIELPDDASIIDIGANIGLFTLRMQQLCKNPTIYAFEPAPAAFDCLRANAKLYCENAHVFHCGVSDADKTLPFTFYKHASVFSSYNADPEKDETAVRAVVQNMLHQTDGVEAGQVAGFAEDFMQGRMESETVDVQLRSLSSAIDEQQITRVDLLKIDAERAEMDVLRGIRDEHWPLVRQIVIEVHDQQGDLIRAVIGLLEEKGFKTELDEEELLRGSGLYNVYGHRATRPAQAASADVSVSETIEGHVRELVIGLKGAVARNPAPFLVCICPPSPQWSSVEANLALQAHAETLLKDELAGLGNVHLVDSGEVESRYPSAADYDAQGDQLGHVPFTRKAYASLGTLIARRLHRVFHPPVKVIVLDCDNTLWRGEVGEDGPRGIGIDGPYAALQEFMVRQHETGMLICLCSKNNKEDVEDVFERRPDMILRREHMVATRINWLPKSRNIQELARELNLGLDSFAFIDDNPVECAEVQASCPEVLVLQLPANEGEIPAFLEHVWAFDQLGATDEDRRRTALYATNMERESARAEAPSLKDFIGSLELDVSIGPLTPETLPRASQLTQRTNQFNFTTVRRSEADISAACDSAELRCLITRVRDRFGDYGLVGLQLFGTSPTALILDTMLLSCRVLGRGVEHQMLARLGALAQKEGLAEVHAIYEPSKNNAPALQFLDFVGGDYKEEQDGRTLYRFPAAELATLTYEPAESAAGGSAVTPGKRQAAARPADSQLSLRIATELRDPDRVLEQVQKHHTQERPSDLGEYVVPASELEREIAGIWQKILGIDQISIHDNFFEIGGTSLKAVQVIAQMMRDLGVELRAVALFESTTIHALAAMLGAGGDDAARQELEKSRSRGARRRARRSAPGS